MFKIRVANITIEIDNRYAYLSDYCADWLCDGKPAFRVKVPASEIDCYMKNCGYETTPDVVERVLMCRKIAQRLPETGAFLLHGGVIKYEDKGIIFSAKRGVGKTTHINLWKRAFGDKVRVVNGDKPFITKCKGKFYACGTPWRGKEGVGDNSSAVVSKLCFIERASTPYTRKITPTEAWELFSKQTVYPTNGQNADAFAAIVAEFLRSVDTYVIGVNMDVESAIVVKNNILTV